MLRICSCLNLWCVQVAKDLKIWVYVLRPFNHFWDTMEGLLVSFFAIEEKRWLRSREMRPPNPPIDSQGRSKRVSSHLIYSQLQIIPMKNPHEKSHYISVYPIFGA